MMDWDETDLISAFETLPTYDEEGEPTYVFSREDGGVRLCLSVWPYAGEVAVDLYVAGDERPVFATGFIPCAMLRRECGADGSETVEVLGPEGVDPEADPTPPRRATGVVTRRTLPAPQPERAMQRVYSNPDAAVAHLVRNALDQHGIEAVVRGDRLGPAVGEVAWTDAWAEVWVGDEGRLDEAHAVVAEVTTGAEGAPPGAPWTCPACGEVGEPAFGACWKCGAERPD